MEKDNLHEEAQKRLEELSILIGKIESQLKTASKDKIWCQQKGKCMQYYKIDSHKNYARTYIHKKDIQIAKNAVFSEYYGAFLSVLKQNTRALKRFSAQYDFHKLVEVYKKLPYAKKLLVSPLIQDDESFASQWQSRNYEHKKEQPEENLVTLKNEHVRSKSEVIIANLLNAKKIPYHYEFPLELKDGYIIYPDFICLNKRTRQEFYWEHCGKMDDSEYSASLVKRLSLLAQKNILPGKNLILTMESTAQPLNTREVERIIETFLL